LDVALEDAERAEEPVGVARREHLRHGRPPTAAWENAP